MQTRQLFVGIVIRCTKFDRERESLTTDWFYHAKDNLFTNLNLGTFHELLIKYYAICTIFNVFLTTIFVMKLNNLVIKK